MPTPDPRSDNARLRLLQTPPKSQAAARSAWLFIGGYVALFVVFGLLILISSHLPNTTPNCDWKGCWPQ